MSKKRQHVVPTEGGWGVVKEGSNRKTVITDTKKEAEEIGREIARNQKTELVIHGKDGKIQDSDSYGKDPNPPKDTKH